MLGRKSVHAEECRTGSFIGANFDILEDLRTLPASFLRIGASSTDDTFRYFSLRTPARAASAPGCGN